MERTASILAGFAAPTIPRIPALAPRRRSCTRPARPRRARVSAVMLSRAAYLGPIALHKVQRALELARSVNEPTTLARNLAVGDLCAQLGMECDTVCAAVLCGLTNMVGIRTVDAAVGHSVIDILNVQERIEAIVARDGTYADMRQSILLAARDEQRALSLHLAASAVGESTRREWRARCAMYVEAPLAKQLKQPILRIMLEDGAFRQLKPGEYAVVNEALGARLGGDILNIVKSEMESMFASRVMGRVKGRYSTYCKMRRNGKSLDEIYDVLALRVILAAKQDEDCEACYTVANAIRDRYSVVSSREKDYISSPKPNGYQSLHLVVLAGKEKLPIEVQIRSEKMHQVAEFGAAAEWNSHCR